MRIGSRLLLRAGLGAGKYAGVRIVELTTSEQTLESIFLELTGRKTTSSQAGARLR